MTRTEAIAERLIEHVEGVGSVALSRSLEGWDTHADTLHAPFGYLRPVWGDYRSYVAFCPELIAKTTAELNDDDLGDYLTCVEVQIDYYVAHFEMTDDAASEWFDRYVAQEFMGSLALMNRVQMGWLDKVQS